MKKTLTLALCLILAALCTIGTFASPTGKDRGTVGGTSQTMTLDAKKDAGYDDGAKFDGSIIQEKGGKGKSTATYWVTYTKDAIWIYAEIADSTLAKKNNDEKKPSYEVDSIEIMLDPDNKGENTPDKLPLQMRIDSYNLVSARKGQKGTSLYLRKSEGGTVDFFEAQSVKTAAGFNAEYKIPVSGLAKGKQIGFNFCYNDWDNGSNRETIGTNQLATSWQAERYEFFTLGDIKAATTAAATTKAAATTAAKAATASAAKTADVSVVVAAVATIALAGVVVCRKKH